MALEDYVKAYKLGKRDYQYRMLHGMQPTVQVLDDILPGRGTYSEVSWTCADTGGSDCGDEDRRKKQRLCR